MIEGRCIVMDSVKKHEEADWPWLFVAVPRIGEWVTGNSNGRPVHLPVFRVLHTHGQRPVNAVPTTVPMIEVWIGDDGAR